MKTVRFALILAMLSLLVGCADSSADPIPPEPPAIGSVQQQTTTAFISAAEAESAALRHADIAAADSLDISSRLDYDDGIAEYDIDFCHDGIEYDYDIDAESGEIRSFDTDACDHEAHLIADDTDRISRDEAVSIALGHAGVALSDAQKLEVELDRERDREEYEVSFDSDGYEYDYDIDAATGKILRAEKEWDD